MADSAPVSYYEILGISPQSPSYEIRRAYHRLLRLCHPDKWALRGESAGNLKFTVPELQKIYTTLIDENQRASYDLQLQKTLIRQKRADNAVVWQKIHLLDMDLTDDGM
jgi:DnaJ-class molecular chaperone